MTVKCPVCGKPSRLWPFRDILLCDNYRIEFDGKTRYYCSNLHAIIFDEKKIYYWGIKMRRFDDGILLDMSRL